MRARINISGMYFGRLLVLGYSHTNKGFAFWHVRCVCGTNKTVMGNNLKNGTTKACGCLQRGSRIKHKMSYTPTYETWAGMIKRCTNPKYKYYMDYGGRGIKVCKRWMDSFEKFYADMGERPEGLTIERIDNNNGYNPSNCKWATTKEQNSNKRNNVFLIYNGKTMVIREWEKAFGLNKGVLNYRIKAGWKTHKALTLPVKIS